jgi:hypothetical protein
MSAVFRTSQAHLDLVEIAFRIAEENSLAADGWLDVIEEKCRSFRKCRKSGKVGSILRLGFAVLLSAIMSFSTVRFWMEFKSFASCTALAISLLFSINILICGLLLNFPLLPRAKPAMHAPWIPAKRSSP